MIPLYDNVPTRRFPVVTVALIVINVAVFVYELALPGGQEALSEFVYRLGTVPYEYGHQIDVPPPNLVPWWSTWFTAMFLHGGFLHIIFNMLFLWIFGNNVEDAMGRVKFACFYVLCGLVAAGSQIGIDLHGQVPAIGASGAIAGVLGAYIVLFPRARVLSLIFLIIFVQVIWVPAWILLVIWFAFQLLDGVASLGSETVEVAYFEHIGGFVIGMLLVFVFTARSWRRAAAGSPPLGRGPLPWVRLPAAPLGVSQGTPTPWASGGSGEEGQEPR
jgi:membrane associated rhomboid family serine protease